MITLPILGTIVEESSQASSGSTALILGLAAGVIALTVIGVMVWRAKQARRSSLRIVLDDNVEIDVGGEPTHESVMTAVDTILTVDAEEAARAVEATRSAAATTGKE